ncbi:hydrogenase maturation protease [filamentous cyanobacterium CCP5]|nr:hydrogenase maturation protease [filamentous cyanobacterium CCP5]
MHIPLSGLFPHNPEQATGSLLVIGYGNDLRGDDAVGPWVAHTVAAWNLPAVESISVQQLTPELAIAIAQASYVIFVDSCVNADPAGPLALEPIVMTPPPGRAAGPALHHTCEPSALLNLTQAVDGHHPLAWLLQVPSEDYGLGRPLSQTAAAGGDRALRIILAFWQHHQQPREHPDQGPVHA